MADSAKEPKTTTTLSDSGTIKAQSKPESSPSRGAGEEAWWRPGIIVFSEVTGLIVVPIIIALYLGRYLDEKNGTTNLYFLSLTGVAFIITTVGIGLLAVRYIKQVERTNDKEKRENNNGHRR